jgi:hypothetical protein
LPTAHTTTGALAGCILRLIASFIFTLNPMFQILSGEMEKGLPWASFFGVLLFHFANCMGLGSISVNWDLPTNTDYIKSAVAILTLGTALSVSVNHLILTKGPTVLQGDTWYAKYIKGKVVAVYWWHKHHLRL